MLTKAALTAAATFVASGMAGVATASTPPPVRMNVGQAADLVGHANLPRPHQGGGYFGAGPVKTTVCTGQGTSTTAGFRAFACTVTALRETFTAWARSTPKGFCVSSVGPGVCAAGYGLRNDPRMCATGTTWSADACVYAAARTFVLKRAGGPGGAYQGESSCNPVRSFVFSCVLDQTYTVTMIRGAQAWTITATP